MKNFKRNYYIPSEFIYDNKYVNTVRSFHFDCIGHYINSKGHKMIRLNPEFYMIQYCTDGEGTLILNEKEYSVKKGDLFFCLEGYRHEYKSSNENPWTVYWAHFSGQDVMLLLSLMGISINLPVVNIGMNHLITSSFEQIFEIIEQGQSTAQFLYIQAIFRQMFTYLGYSINMSTHISEKSMKLSSVISFLQNNVQNNLTLDDMANFCNVSKFHFTRIFKELTGFSPVEYFNGIKMQKGCELLTTTEKTVNEISNYLGFKNQFYFSQTFKKHMGKSPTSYRASMDMQFRS